MVIWPLRAPAVPVLDQPTLSGVLPLGATKVLPLGLNVRASPVPLLAVKWPASVLLPLETVVLPGVPLALTRMFSVKAVAGNVRIESFATGDRSR